MEGPRLCPPVGFTLVFRDSAHPPVTIWRPVAPRGYAEVGIEGRVCRLDTITRIGVLS